MKKTVLFSLLLVFSSLLSYAQGISSDEISDDGIRTIVCKIKFLDYSAIGGVSLGCSTSPDGESSYILLLVINADNIEISEGRKLLIDLSDGETMKLACSIAKDPTRPVIAYDITESEIKELISEKITKMSVEYDSGCIVQDVTDNEIPNALKQMYNKIQKTLKSAPQVTAEPATELTEYAIDGDRFLFCSTIALNYPIINGVSLSCLVHSDGESSYNLVLDISAKNIQISAGRKLLIKLGDGTIKEFTSYGEKQPTDNVVGYGDITKSEIEQFISKKITKIRVEYDSGYLDQEITDNELSAALQQMNDEIQEAMYDEAEETQSSIDIYSGF